jgi:hypothetical protein
LKIFDGKPQDSWLGGDLTINGLIAILATICRTCLMFSVAACLAQGKWNQLESNHEVNKKPYQLGSFALFDEASKGPWGSTRLLWKYKGLHLACMGASITIFSLALGAFSQQLVGLETRETATESLGSAGDVPRSSRVGLINLEDPRNRGGYSMLSSDVKLAILNGAMGSANETVPPPQVTCPSGNCTWPVIPTIGVCGGCINATDTIELQETADQSCNLTSSLGMFIEGHCFTPTVPFPGIFVSRSQPQESGFSRGFSVNASSPNFIIDFAGLRPGHNEDGSRSFNGSQAAQCALWYCLQTRNISVRSGQLHDTILSTYHDTEVTTAMEGNKPPFSSAASDFRFRDLPPSLENQEETYTGLWWQITAIQSYFIFLTEAFIQGDKNNYRSIGYSNQTGGLFVEGFYQNFDRLDIWISRLATSMTNELRTTGFIGLSNSDYTDEQHVEELEADIKARFKGTVFVNQVIIVVRWKWITFPAALIALSVVFLIIQIAHTADRQDVRPWKDDALVPLSLQLDPALRMALQGGLDEPNGRNQVADHEVQISRDINGRPVGFHLKVD